MALVALGVHHEAPGAGEAGRVIETFERGDRARRHLHRATLTALAADPELVDRGLEDRGADRIALLAGLVGDRHRLVEDVRGRVEVTLLEIGVAEVDHELEPEVRRRRQQRDGPAQQVDRGRDVAPGERALARRGELDRGPFADPARIVDRSQLDPIAIRLLEVVAEDLLELELATTLAVDRVGPVDEPFVELGAGPLEQASIGRILDDRVPEPVEVRLGDGRADELLGGQGLEPHRDLRHGVFGDEVDERIDREARGR